jgi:flagellar motor protein MotB
MDVVGRGSREPLADNDSETGRARNRRVELFLSEPQG